MRLKLTITLRDGTRVLGKMYKGEVRPATYANRAQARAAAERENGEVIQRGRPFYVRLSEESDVTPMQESSRKGEDSGKVFSYNGNPVGRVVMKVTP